MTRTSAPVPESGAAVRVTLHPGTELLLRSGTRIGELRAPLAALTRRPELRHATLVVDGVEQHEDQVVGERPLLPGAVVRVLPLPDRHGQAPWRSAGQELRGTGRWHGAGARRWHGARRWLVVRVTGPSAGVVTSAVGLWGIARARLRLRGAGRLVVRRACTPAERLLPAAPPSTGGPAWVLAVLPVLASLGLAAALRQPVLAVFALVGLLAVVPQLRRAGRGPGAPGAAGLRAGPADRAVARDRSRDLPGPAGLLAFAEAAHRVSPGAWAAARAAHTAHTAHTGRADGGVPATGAAPWPSGPHEAGGQLLDDGSVAVLGPVHLAAPVARALVAGLAVRGAAVRVRGSTVGWSWLRWLPDGGRPVLVVDAGSGPAPADLTDVTGRRSLVVAVGTVPSGCRTVVRVLSPRRVEVTGPDGGVRTAPLVGVTTEWAEHLARLLAGAAWLGRTARTLDAGGSASGTHGADAQVTGAQVTDAADLPAVVSLAGVHGFTDAPSPDAVAARWAAADDWAVPLGAGAARAVVPLDLVGDGPHLLVAGTTGSGKSELLQTLVLGLALIRSPAELAVVLVDFKGGASFGACSGLPHVVGRVTDLEHGLAARALDGLRAELRRRERVLADHGVPDVTDLAAGTLPRLVVVIDEFRALADDLPEFLPALLRVAAQGRSLGVHLVLATQRPGGAVGPDLRANVSARIALRVTDPLESRDVIEDPAAAYLASSTPGRAVLRVGSAPTELLQCAQAAAPPEARQPVVRYARAWPARAGLVAPADVPPPDLPRLLVESVRRAARSLGHVAGAPPWLPQLPRHVTSADLPPARRRHRGHLVVGLGDDPGGQRRTTVAWDPDDGHVAIVGAGRSGRTTALVTLGLAALRQGRTVHGITRRAADLVQLTQHPGYGTTVHPDDTAAIGRLLSTAVACDSRAVVLVDGADDVRGALPPAALRSGAAFALTADGASVGGLAAQVTWRLVLLGTDRAHDVMLGAPARFAGAGGPPGRGVWCGRGEPVLCQVLVPVPRAGTGPAGTGAGTRSRSARLSGGGRRGDDGGRHQQRTDDEREQENHPATGHGEARAAADRSDGSDDLKELPGHDGSTATTAPREHGFAAHTKNPGDTQQKQHQKDAYTR